MLFLAACSDDPDTDQSKDLVSVRVEATASDAFTRGESAETVVADRCILEIYNMDGTLYNNVRLYSVADASGNFSFEPRLLEGRSYKLVFWADKSGGTLSEDLHYDTSGGLRAIAPSAAGPVACDIAGDAFYEVIDLTADQAQSLTVTLRRAVCRVNVNTGFSPAATGTYDVTAFFVNAPARFDAMTGDVSGTIEFTSTATVGLDASTPLSWFTYLFAPEEQGVCTVDFDLSATDQSNVSEVFSREFQAIPLQRNYQVNVTVKAGS